MDLTFQASGFWGVLADIVLLAAGLALIVKGGDVFVDSSVKIARSLGVPEIIVGATIVSVGTTLPEIVTSTTSVIKGMAESDAMLAAGYNSLAVGNAVGSMMCNTGLILGIVLAIKPPRPGEGFAAKGIFLLCVSALLGIFTVTGGAVQVWEGVVLLALFVIFVGLNVYGAAMARNSAHIRIGQIACKAEMAVNPKDKLKTAAFFMLGAISIALGAVLLVDNAQSLCVGIGIPQQIVGVTVVALGTSLPELVTSLTSLKKGSTDIGVGNVIGANVINATLLSGLIACLSGQGIGIDEVTRNVAVWVTLAICALLVIPSALTKKTYRWQGAAMLALYLGFIVYNIIIIVL